MMNESFDLDTFIERALAEDVGDGDHTTLSTIPADAQGKAKLLVKEAGILAGVSIAQKVFEKVDPQLVVDMRITDGHAVQPGDIAFYVSGSSRSITIAERLALNIMQRMSGIATKTRRIQDLMQGTSCKLLDTRKTTPGFRYFEKLAVKIGGGENHRFGLYDMILVKDNHVDYAGGIAPALHQIKAYIERLGKPLKVEVEARNLDEVKQILNENIAFRILLDNFTPEAMKEAVDFIAGRVETEASGGINETNVRAYALTGVNYVSMGALTHQIQSLDLSLKAVK
jgi:nicotinate-nucleotide pyrophosphorylase (carboxylating)